MKNLIVYSESYLTFPVTTNLAMNGRVAVKNSVLSFIQGLTIESSQGTQITAETTSTPIIANLRLLFASVYQFVSLNKIN